MTSIQIWPIPLWDDLAIYLLDKVEKETLNTTQILNLQTVVNIQLWYC